MPGVSLIAVVALYIGRATVVSYMLASKWCLLELHVKNC